MAVMGRGSGRNLSPTGADRDEGRPEEVEAGRLEGQEEGAWLFSLPGRLGGWGERGEVGEPSLDPRFSLFPSLWSYSSRPGLSQYYTILYCLTGQAACLPGSLSSVSSVSREVGLAGLVFHDSF